MSRWKSRWSRPRLRNTATSKTTPPTRPITRAWLETSIAQASTPRSTIRREQPRAGRAPPAWSGRCDVLAQRSGCRRCRSPRPGRRRRVSPLSSRRVVVVLPWVPVTPIIRSRAAGSPYTSAASAAEHRRTVGTTSVGAAPRSRAAPAASVSDRDARPRRAPAASTPRRGRGRPAARRTGRRARPGGSRASTPVTRDAEVAGRRTPPRPRLPAGRRARRGQAALPGPGQSRSPRAEGIEPRRLSLRGRGASGARRSRATRPSRGGAERLATVGTGHHVVGICDGLAPVGGTP